MRRRLNRATFDPVKEYDGLVQYGPNRVTPERRTELAREALAVKTGHPLIEAQDAEAARTPVGGMQFR